MFRYIIKRIYYILYFCFIDQNCSKKMVQLAGERDLTHTVRAGRRWLTQSEDIFTERLVEPRWKYWSWHKRLIYIANNSSTKVFVNLICKNCGIPKLRQDCQVHNVSLQTIMQSIIHFRQHSIFFSYVSSQFLIHRGLYKMLYALIYQSIKN